MKIRLLRLEDIPKLEQIHDKFYADEFPFPLVVGRKHFDKYVVTDDDDNILMFGTLEANVELIALSDLDADIKLRRDAYKKLIDISLAGAKYYGLPYIYASAPSDAMEKHLKHRGFVDVKHKILLHKV